MNNHHDLFDSITTNTVVLTPNRRLAAVLHQLYQEYQVNQQQPYWETPDILPITSWIQRLWDDYASKQFNDTPNILNQIQENHLWETILIDDKESALLLQTSETADIAKSAWGLLQQWQVSINNNSFKSSNDYLALQRWSLQFQTRCNQLNSIDTASLLNLMTEQVVSKNVSLPAKIIFIGFTEHSPQLKYFIDCCKIQGTKITASNLFVDNNECSRISLQDKDEEILTLACWAKAIHQNNASAKIACVIPSLDKIRDRVSQVFSEVFADKNNFRIDLQAAPFNISAGKQLLNYPIIHAAMQLLELYKKSISAEDLSYLLSSPFLGDAEAERIKRGNFESLLRRSNINKIDLISSVTEAENNHTTSIIKNCSRLAKRIQKFIKIVNDNPKENTYKKWAEIFNQLLSALGWPGERSLSSEEYQIVESWLNVMSDFISLDQIAKPVNYHLALQSLRKIISKSTFQPKTPEAPIQVLGILEAASLPFDYLWVSGMDDISWPPQPKPNPFIPKQLQRELNMPHATAERELIYCQEITNQFKQSAAHVIFSHASKNEDIELQASALIREFKEATLLELNLPEFINVRDILYQSRKIEKIIDDIGPSLLTNEKPRGGVNVIKQQALCPFKAFAEWRLHAHELESPLPGLRAKDRGNIIHKILELIWNTLHDQATLINYSHDQLSQVIHESIDKSFELIPNARSEYKQYISLEKKRLFKLVFDWMQVEKTRPPFKVLHNEIKTDIQLNQLNLSVRIDRIDELADSNKIIIDYKTGKHNDVNNWFGNRPEEPQLPLYTLLDPDHIFSIAFAQIATGDHCFKGVSSDELNVKGIKVISEIKKTNATSWHEQQTEWEQTLKKLSDDFYNGVAIVDPKDLVQTCTWCALKPFCRINDEQI